MRAYHNTRNTAYRCPYGAVKAGETVFLSLDVFDAAEVECTCRLWVDGKGERLVPMKGEALEVGTRFSCTVTQAEPDLLWYSFIISSEGAVYRYGAMAGRVGGEGSLYDYEPPSFQITVYRERKVPDWYKKGIVYQIFPDRFARGGDFRQRAEKALTVERAGPARVLCEDWYAPPRYEKDEKGRVESWDFYGGTFSGIALKLGYLKELGVTALYLNPIFEAASNHRYDTGDYLKIDTLLGEDEDFKTLCDAAAAVGISLILDGVFNHTGCDSRYFNKYENYRSVGAFQSQDSPYREWFHIEDGVYSSWWGVDDLPDVEENSPSYRAFIYGGEGSVVRQWLRRGGRGWRLDVADELPDDFIAELKGAMLETKADSVLIGEVWEDASNKISYGKLRRYLLGEELDSAMNYPLRDAFLNFITGGASAETLCESLESLKENYPTGAFYSALNLMGSHDRIRLLTVLGDAPSEDTLSEAERVSFKLTSAQRDLAKARLWLVTLCQMTLPGVPCIYYGDEAGLEGYSDPCNRAGFPWGREDPDAGAIYRNAIALRKSFNFFTQGSYEPFYRGGDVFGFTRLGEEGEGAVVLINKSLWETHTVRFPVRGEKCFELVSGQRVKKCGEEAEITLPPLGSAVVYFYNKPGLGKAFERGVGVLCHVTSLPKAGGPGTFGKPAEQFIDFLQASGQKYWQMLPLNPTDAYGSPYAGISAFAGNTALMDTGGETLRQRFERYTPTEDFLAFCHKNQNWLDKYAAFMALQDKFHGLKWQIWPEEYRKFNPDLLREPGLSEEILFYKYGQYEFFRQWQSLRHYAREKGILIIGDLPIYVSEDSADVWGNQEEFSLDAAGYKKEEAGAPPDYFSAEGQHWGNPLYDWTAMEKKGYTWWLERLAWAIECYDYVRLDHFRGFESFWAIPRGKTAKEGRWLYGPGAALFEMAAKKLGSLPMLAEDLGSLTPGVRALVAKCGFMGTDVMQFYDGDLRKGYFPPEGKAVYTGTHDNQTLRSWCENRYPEEDPEKMAATLMIGAMESGADLVMLPLQDVLGLDDRARMNTPGTVSGNWLWQAEIGDFDGAAERLSDMMKLAGRS